VVTIGGGFVLLSKLDVGFGAFMRDSVVKARGRAAPPTPRSRAALLHLAHPCSACSAARRGVERVVCCQSTARPMASLGFTAPALHVLSGAPGHLQ